MPRLIDHAERRTAIAHAAIRILARGGTQSLTLKSLARELGGSITLVTHFFATRGELFEALIDDLVSSYEASLQELDAGRPADERLRRLLDWMVPRNPEEAEMEAGRLALISQRGEQASIDHFFQVMEDRMRDLLRERVRPLLEAGPDDVEAAVDHLRAVTNGLTLSVVEHPELWTPERIDRVLDTTLRGLNLMSPAPLRTSIGAGEP